MNTDLARLHNLLRVDLHPLHIPILVLAIQQQIPIEPWEVIFVQVTALPSFLSDYLFCLVVYVVNGSLQRFSCLVVEGPEHASVAKVMLVQVKVGEFSKVEQGWPQGVVFRVVDEVVIYLFCLHSIVRQTGDANKHKLQMSHFPHCRNGNLCFGAVGQEFSDVVGKFITIKFALFLISQIKSSELKSLIMPSFEPADHRVIICLSNHILISPNLITFEFSEWLLIFSEGVPKI